VDAGGYELQIDAAARRALNRIPERSVWAILECMQGPLRVNPRRVGKPLNLELAGRFGARVGDYRLVYSIDEAHGVVVVVRVEHRSDVYRPR
jgi:mRNA interferase RelE/StbE